MGAMEAFGVHIGEKLDMIASNMPNNEVGANDIAVALSEIAEALKLLPDGGLNEIAETLANGRAR
jgi:hypothetical protein